MGNDDHYIKTLNDLLEKLTGQLSEAKRTLALINSIEEHYNLPKTSIAELGQDTQGTESVDESPQFLRTPRTSTARIRPDEYLGDKPMVAAKKYIQKVGHAVRIEDIARAVESGGAAIQGLNWIQDLKESLTRSVKDVVKVQEGVFGLVDFYTAEQIRGIRSTRRGVGVRSPTVPRKRGRPRKQ